MVSILEETHSSSNVIRSNIEITLKHRGENLYNRPTKHHIEQCVNEIRHIGESSCSFVEECSVLKDMISREISLSSNSSEAIFKTINALIIEQPHKQPDVAFLIIGIAEDEPQVSILIISYLIQELQTQLDLTRNNNKLETSPVEPWTAIKLFTRFLSLLSPILNLRDIVNHYKSILKLAYEINNKNAVLGNLILESVLLNIPYLFYFNRKNKILQFEIINLINVTEVNFTGNHQVIDLYHPFCLENVKNSNKSQVTIAELKQLLYGGLDKFNKIFPESINTISELSCKKLDQQWTLHYPTVSSILALKETQTNNYFTDCLWNSPLYQDYEAQFGKISNTSNKTPIKKYSKQVVRDNIIDIVHNIEFNKIEACEKLMQFHKYFQDIYLNCGWDDCTENIYRIVIQTIVSLLLRLPHSTIPNVYYATLLQQFCKKSPKQFAPLIGEHFRFLYKNLYNLDYETNLEFEKWFRFQVTNFNYQWKWDEWIDDCDKYQVYSYNAKWIFHVNVVKRLASSTSNLQEFKMSLPLTFQNILSKKYFDNYNMIQYMNNLFDFDHNCIDFEDVGLLYLQDGFPFNQTVLHILDCMHIRNNDGTNGDINELIHLVEQIGKDNLKFFKNFEIFKIIILIQCICHSGRRSLSHANRYIEALGDTIFEIFQQVEINKNYLQFVVIDSVIRYWNSNVSTGFLLINSFKQFDFVSDLVIVDFLFCDANHELKIITNYEAREYLLQTLEENMRWSEGSNYELFIRSYRLTLKIISDALNELNIGDQTTITLPDFMEESETQRRNSNSTWKYFEGIKLIKCLLRKFHCVYRQLTDILFDLPHQIDLTHFQTIERIALWIKECQNLG
ncbi:similar to Saccharomyces cerevisiae YMR125W STO1 Large subunit of the nuclear mRNA cap-binding protein complex, interacts with Npl3p to carry nuclear poly(A)+ mRNA to cytoplasm [Maudiozyma saulgeensis]|uniref:Similar to Saccharomyces cerevisiae YMR125W STO1 Large subunit of the nuclear mRNA cap-binding protein complex, interacts with Npl3p to carry nuclear poly(A)+ mRNA to cytoplasm n=1 Tax=Maudiozyma saulgeensis TaxID=1789683 RepID=A0A1X7R021_9SACH|nr:similar to Saccharomyces cerevisiae YMR125W STO1 Large subunit of the nuclear mRNA cap-binding protein complex, interacts with Npl3p to carry nuclear poly(A)+ mRNA to cytoplasm [Kazachstania saulgeensis]